MSTFLLSMFLIHYSSAGPNFHPSLIVDDAGIGIYLEDRGSYMADMTLDMSKHDNTVVSQLCKDSVHTRKKRSGDIPGTIKTWFSDRCIESHCSKEAENYKHELQFANTSRFKITRTLGRVHAHLLEDDIRSLFRHQRLSESLLSDSKIQQEIFRSLGMKGSFSPHLSNTAMLSMLSFLPVGCTHDGNIKIKVKSPNFYGAKVGRLYKIRHVGSFTDDRQFFTHFKIPEFVMHSTESDLMTPMSSEQCTLKSFGIHLCEKHGSIEKGFDPRTLKGANEISKIDTSDESFLEVITSAERIVIITRQKSYWHKDASNSQLQNKKVPQSGIFSLKLAKGETVTFHRRTFHGFAEETSVEELEYQDVPHMSKSEFDRLRSFTHQLETMTKYIPGTPYERDEDSGFLSRPMYKILMWATTWFGLDGLSDVIRFAHYYVFENILIMPVFYIIHIVLVNYIYPFTFKCIQLLFKCIFFLFRFPFLCCRKSRVVVKRSTIHL